jgi:predicted metal-dependent hydrolase
MRSMAEARAKLSDEFERGLQLFNTGRFFEAHEVWEVVWKRSAGVEKTLLQALIQAAAALLHVERGNFRGARSTWAKARIKFQGGPANLMGLELQEFCAALDDFMAVAATGKATDRVPRLRLAGAGSR